MYVIFPAEDLVELTLTRPTSEQIQQNSQGSPSCPPPANPPSPSRPPKVTSKSSKKDKDQNQRKKKLSKQEQGERNIRMATGTGEGTLRDLSHPSLNDQLKNHNAVTFKLVRTVSDFTQELSQMYEQHAEELQLLVANFRKKNAELRKERPACSSSLFHTWETLLQEVEVDSQAHSDIASVFGRQVSRPLLERSFHRKVQSRKVFAHRESFEVLITKAEEKLAKARQDYKAAYLGHMAAPSNTATLAAYLDAHNNYVTQLHATNGMVETYSHETLPLLLQELEEVYSDLCTTLSDSVLQGAEVISSRATEQSRRYEALSTQCRTVTPASDLAHFSRSLSPLPPQPHPSHRLRLFTPPQPPHQDSLTDPSMADAPVNNDNAPPPLKNELVVDRLASIQVRSRYEALRVEAVELETQIKQLQDALDTMARIQQRSLESQLYNKVNELQEDISIKRFDLRTAQIHLAAVRAQKDLFASKLDAAEGAGSRDRKMSSSSTASMKSKWLKAFTSLKTKSGPSNGTSPKEGEKKNGRDSGGLNLGLESSAHQFQEYTYKKITPCDVCSQVLRGHTRQGLKCRVCKLNVHLDCQEKVGRCQAKSRLLRRQKSTSEIETRVIPAQEEEAISLVANRPGRSSVSPAALSQGGSPSPRSVTWKTPPARSIADQASPGEVDSVYQVLKQAGEISTSRSRELPPARRAQQPPLSLRGASSLSVGPAPHASSSEQAQYAAGTRPFGQPLVLGGSQENGSTEVMPSPSPISQTKMSNKKR